MPIQNEEYLSTSVLQICKWIHKVLKSRKNIAILEWTKVAQGESLKNKTTYFLIKKYLKYVHSYPQPLLPA